MRPLGLSPRLDRLRQQSHDKSQRLKRRLLQYVMEGRPGLIRAQRVHIEETNAGPSRIRPTPSSTGSFDVLETRRKQQLLRLQSPIILEALGDPRRAFLFESGTSSFPSLQPTPPDEDDDLPVLMWSDVVQPERPRLLRLSVVGLANSGKSSLVNRVVGSKMSAVTPKRNTTRASVIGVRTRSNVQLIIHDTPGILVERDARQYERELSEDALSLVSNSVDLVVLMIDAAKSLGQQEHHLIKKVSQLKEMHTELQIVLVLNKVDLVHPKLKLLDIAQNIVKMCPSIRDVFYLSVLQNDGVDEFEEFLFDRAQPGEFEWDQNTASELSPVERVTEIIREKIFLTVHDEVPYEVQQSNKAFTRLDSRTIRIDQQIRVQSESHKSILIGPQGRTLQWIQREASREIADILSVERVLLYLQVQRGLKNDAIVE